MTNLYKSIYFLSQHPAITITTNPNKIPTGLPLAHKEKSTYKSLRKCLI